MKKKNITYVYHSKKENKDILYNFELDKKYKYVEWDKKINRWITKLDRKNKEFFRCPHLHLNPPSSRGRRREANEVLGDIFCFGGFVTEGREWTVLTYFFVRVIAYERDLGIKDFTY